MLFVGERGGRVSDACGPLAQLADVVVVTSDDIVAARADDLAAVPAAAVIRAGDRDKVLDAGTRYAAEHRVDGALTFSEDMLADTARFAAGCGLPGQPVESIAAFQDKYAQRRALAAAGLPTPAFAEITDPEQGRAALDRVRLPAVLKPTRGSGSALTYVVESPSDLDSYLGEASRSAARVGGAVAAGTAFILEELVAGDPSWHPTPGFAPYVSVESAAVGGRYLHLGVTDRFPVAPPLLETGMMLPSGLPPDRTRAVMDAADRALRALDFRHGLAHVELMLADDGPVVIEVNARAGGAVPYLMPMAGGADLVALAGRVALGELPDVAPQFHRHAVFVAPQHPIGVQVDEVRGLEEVAQLPPVRLVIPLATRGVRTDHFRHTMVAAVLGVVDGPAAAVELWDRVMRTVRPSYVAEPS